MATLLGATRFKNDCRLEFYAKGNQVTAKLFQKDRKLGTLNLEKPSNQSTLNYETLSDSARSKINEFLSCNRVSLEPERVSLPSSQETGSPQRSFSIPTSPSSTGSSSNATFSILSYPARSVASSTSTSQSSLEELQTFLVQYKVPKEEIESLTRKTPSSELQPLLSDALFEQIFSLDRTPALDSRLLDIRGSKGYNLLMASITLEKDEKFKELVPFYRRTNALHAEDHQGKNALHLAAALGHASIIKDLIELGMTTDKADSDGLMPLHWAIHERKVEAAQVLLQNGALLSQPCIYQGAKLYPVEMTVAVGDVDLLKVLLESDPFNQINFTRPIPGFGNLLHFAIHANQSQMLEYLLSSHLDTLRPLLNQRDPQGRTPLQLAAFLGDLNAIQQLHSRGVDLNYGDGEVGGTAVHYAALGEQPDAITLLDWLGAPLTCLDNNCVTPILLLEGKKSPLAKECKSLLTRLPRIDKADKTAPPNFSKRPPFNLVIQGGGPKGIAYLGVIQAMEEGQTLSVLKRVAGTSAGAITAAFLAVGCDSKRLGELLDKDLGELLDAEGKLESGLLKAAQGGSYQEAIKGLLKDYWNGWSTLLHPVKRAQALKDKLQHLTGLASGETLRLWVEAVIKEKTGIEHCTFKELKGLTDKDPQTYKELYAYSLCCTDKSPTPKLVRFSHEEERWENLIISDAVRASVSIPGVFQPHVLHFKDASGRHSRNDLGKFIDPGLIRNLPIDTFDDEKYQEDRFVKGDKTNRRTLGLSLQDVTPKKAEEEIENLSSPSDLVNALISTYYYAEQILLEETGRYKDRTIIIPIKDVGLLDFNVSKKAKEDMIASGKVATAKFFPVITQVTTLQNRPD